LTAIDPAAAANAWLARLPQAQRLAADVYTDTRLVGWIVGGLAVVAICWLLTRSALFARLRRTLETTRPPPWLAAAALAGVLAFALGAANAVVGGVTAWRGDQILAAGGGAPRAAGLAAHLISAASWVMPTVAAAVLLAPPLLWLMRRRPKSWPLFAGAAVMAVILAVGWLPYALSAGSALGPAPPSPTRDGVMRLIAETGLPAHEVLMSPEPGFDADVTGGFGKAKVVLGPLLLAGPPTEARADIGHLMGHYAHNDILLACLIFGLVLSGGLFAVQSLGRTLARWLGARSVEGPSDPEALPALAIIGFAALVVASLAGSAYLRWANVRADSYSLDHAREPDGVVTVLERDWNHDSVDPTPLEAAIFYTHPPLKSRLRHAMDWKAAHGG
jgi:STE24 endopeptidase